jgi:hypothetical protein
MASVPTAAGELRLGQEWHGFRLDDYWPAVPGSMMMGPRTYLNINDGKRDRTVLLGELETRHAARWMSVLGLRCESVRMDTGEVQAYGTSRYKGTSARACSVNAWITAGGATCAHLALQRPSSVALGKLLAAHVAAVPLSTNLPFARVAAPTHMAQLCSYRASHNSTDRCMWLYE